MGKEEMGPNLERVLGLSNKRTVTGHTLKSDAAFLEFNSLYRTKEINEDWFQPADMSWSIEQFVAKQDEWDEKVHTRLSKKIEKAVKNFNEIDAKAKEIISGGKKDKAEELDESLKALA